MSNGVEITTLFDQRPPAAPMRRVMSCYAISMTLHGAGIGLIGYVLLHVPVIKPASLTDRYALRELKVHMPEPTEHEQLYPHVNKEPVKQPAAKKPGPQPPPAPTQETAKAMTPPMPDLPRDGGVGKQILMQPKLHIHQQLTENVPTPSVIMWMPELNQTKIIVPPKPNKPSVALVHPSLAEPNQEIQLSDLSVTATIDEPKIPTPPPATTSPIAQNGSDQVKTAPVTVSNTTDPPTPAAVLSVSNIRMPDGVAVLPPDNETLSGPGKNGAGAQPASSGAGVHPANGGGSNRGAEDSSTSAQASTSQSTDHIELPKDGHFGVVVVGAEQSEDYPEATQIWTDRIAYTVYLHVGLPKTWILQYSQLAATQANGTGSMTHLEAPWPYDIFRPNLLAADVNADALMVHGILNASGKLEQLAVAFPVGYSHTSFVVNALSRWQFRPASQNGKPTPVEILLIIPEEND